VKQVPAVQMENKQPDCDSVTVNLWNPSNLHGSFLPKMGYYVKALQYGNSKSPVTCA